MDCAVLARVAVGEPGDAVVQLAGWAGGPEENVLDGGGGVNREGEEGEEYEEGAGGVHGGYGMDDGGVKGFPYNLPWGGNGDVEIDTIFLNGAIEKLSRRTILSGPDMLWSLEKGFIEGV